MAVTPSPEMLTTREGSIIITSLGVKMAAAIFTPSDVIIMDPSRVVSISGLGVTAIIIGTFLVLGFALIASLVDQRLAAQAAYLVEAESRHESIQQALN